MKKSLLLFFALAVTLPLRAFAQEMEHSREAETTARVPVLTEFHEVIYQIWHVAWPEKNYEMLASLLPEIERYNMEIRKAELPGILREKKEAWNEEIGRLNAIVEEYRMAVDTKDNEKLMDAAERLHMQYEKLVRTIRPAIKELEDFHAVLYMIYHYYMPENDLAKIKKSTGELKQKMAALNKAALPTRLKQKEDSFLAARTKLNNSVDAVVTTVQSDNMEEIKAAIETMHADYESLQGIFD